MKFTFSEAFVQAQEEMYQEEEERVMTINPVDVSAPNFKTFTCSFMFSTMKQLQLLETINKKLDAAIEGNEERDRKIRELEGSIEDLKLSVAHRDGEIEDLKEENEKLRSDFDTYKLETDQKFNTLTELVNSSRKDAKKENLINERHSRSFNLRAFNIPEEPNEKTEKTIEKINNTIKTVTGLDIPIEYGHRTGKRKEDRSPRGVIFRFISRQDRWKVYSQRKKFFEQNIPLYEDMPEADLAEKKKHAAAIQLLYQADKKVAFVRGKWHVNGVEFNG